MGERRILLGKPREWFVRLKAWYAASLWPWLFTGLAGVVLFLFGPFVQNSVSDYLEATFLSEEILIRTCAPLESATLIVSSQNAEDIVVHSANQMPFMQKVHVVVHNNSRNPVSDSELLIIPINSEKNQLVDAQMYTDNLVESKSYSVEKDDGGAFSIKLGNFMAGQTFVLEGLALYPTNFLVEFSSSEMSARGLNQAGTCDLSGVPTSVKLPMDIYSQGISENSDGADPNFKIDDIKGVIGDLHWDVTVRYDCGSGTEEQTVPMNGSISYCGIEIN